MPQAVGILYGAKPVMIAIIVQAIWRLGRMALKGWALLSLGVACFAASLAGIAPILILLLGGGLVLANQLMRSRRHATVSMWLLPFPASGSAAAATGTVGLLSIALAFLKLGVVVFGSGYVLLAFLRAELVDRLHWITNQQLLDAITAGQVTPGPVFATATFLGYLLRGGVGAVVATVGIFLPSFFMAGAVGALAERIRKSKLAAAFLNGVNAAAVALMAEIALVLGESTFVDCWTWVLGIVSAIVLLRFRVNATWLILGGAVIGVLLRSLH